ncbi:hypothetical protein GCM10027271_42970 [Saccharopolyspora gloriosae]|uniref:Type I restriction enzyme S subunit n=1 Tax=Saccharopolyspora gloriosae TaxID=455344 RepID=A0A840NK44_9PSEU|nr:restriction endonuclease subunit S [Saccharopolyspora gloriosae]MBB5070405.1 type I restriction enzyme S subunit [Saccharopolyspora gloriosae]
MSEGWSEIPASEVFSILMGRQRSPQRATGPNMTPYLRSANVGNGSLDFADVKTMDFTAAERERFGLKPGDVLVSEGSASATAVGMAAVWNGELDGEVCFQNTVLRYRAIPGVSEPAFVFQWCRWAFESGAFRAAASGTNIKHIGSSRAEAMRVLLPPPPVQRRIAEVMGAIDDQITALEHEASALWTLYEGSVDVLWGDGAGQEAPARPLSDVMRLDISWTPIEIGSTYRLAGVLNAGRGLVDKGELDAESTEYKRMVTLRENQVVMRKLTAWEGPIAVIPSAFDGYVASNEFPTFALDEGVLPDWMRHVCRSSRLWAEMKSRVKGTVQRRKRLNPEQLLEIELPIPRPPAQANAARVLEAIEDDTADLRTEAERLRRLRSRLLAGLLTREIEIGDVNLDNDSADATTTLPAGETVTV